MKNNSTYFNSIVIGGGFFGTYLASKLSNNDHSCLLIERENDILLRASYVNQARVHNGYHYPRNYLTALRSLINFPRFIKDFLPAIDQSFKKIYAISRHNSKISSDQFYSFCKNVGAPISKLPSGELSEIFDKNLIEDAFLVKEFSFNATKIREMLINCILNQNVSLQLKTEANFVKLLKHKQLLEVSTNRGLFYSPNVFLCAYSGINHFLNKSKIPILPMKHEITEMALVEVPELLRDFAVTIMDGPFFSVMPFPDKKLHTLSHVRYTPHSFWMDKQNTCKNPYSVLSSNRHRSNFPQMIRDASRFIPLISSAKYIESMYEVKTVLQSSEINDSRPILFRENYYLPGLFIIMGGKIDNIYDITEVLKKIDSLRNFTF